MTSTLTIRPATSDDAQPLALLGARAFTSAYEGQVAADILAEYVEYAFTHERLAGELADPASVFLVAALTDRNVGYAKLIEGSDTPAAGSRRPIELARLYVVPSLIGKGVGSALMRAALDEAERRGCDRMWLGVWQENARAIAFYARWGFREVGRQPFTMGSEVHHDVLMERVVSPAPASTMTATGVDEGAGR